MLGSTAVDGWVPPWHRWFPAEDVAAELTDATTRRAVVAELGRLPLAMFTEPAPEIPGWPDAPCGYLRLSGAYNDLLADARSHGWRTASRDSTHLAPAGDPVTAANGLLGLLGLLGSPDPPN